ncbi:MAG: hypothetical protein ACOH17_00820 [Cellulomonas sp.]
MLTVLVWTLVALVAAAAVAAVASATSGGGRQGAGFFADLRAGISARRHPDAEDAAAARAAAVEPVDVRLDEFLRATAVQDDGYLQVDEVRDVLTKARDRAVRSVHHLGSRSA